MNTNGQVGTALQNFLVRRWTEGSVVFRENHSRGENSAAPRDSSCHQRGSGCVS